MTVLAVALLFLKWFPRQSSSFPAADWHRQRKHRHRPRPHRHSTDKLSPPPPTTVILVIASQRPPRAEYFGDHFPQTGRFLSRHKTGRPRAVLEDCDFSVQQDEGGCWAAPLAALAASGTALAYEATDPDSYSTEPQGDAIGREYTLRQDGVGVPQQKSWRAQRRTTTNPTEGIRPINSTLSSTPPLLKYFRAQLSSHLDSLSSWSSDQCDQLRRRQTAAQQHIVFFHEASSLLLARRFQEGGQSLNSAARGAAGWTNMRASQLSGLTAEAGRRAAGVFSVVCVSGKSGLRIISGGLMRRGGRGGSLAGEEEDEEEEGEYEGSRLARLTDMTVQNVVDVVARDGWEHVATTSGVVVHRQYIALGPDGTPAPPSTTGDVGDRAPAAAAASRAGAGAAAAATTTTRSASSSVTAGVSEVGGGGGVEGADVEDASKATQFACVKATAILAVPPEVVYLLFADNSRVGEYNEHCREVMDLEILSPDSKITWAASGRMGPFKVRWKSERGAGPDDMRTVDWLRFSFTLGCS